MLCCTVSHTANGSLLDGFSKPKDLVARCLELGIEGLAVTDHGTAFSHIAIYEEVQKQAKKTGKKLKCILGTESYIALEPVWEKKNRDQTHQIIWAKNTAGLKQLWKMISYTNEPDVFYYKPRINVFNTIDSTGKIFYGLEHFADGNIMSMSGHMGSLLSDALFVDLFGDPAERKKQYDVAYKQYKGKGREFYDSLRKSNWLDYTCELAIKLEKVFGKGNFWIELQNELSESDKLPMWIHPTIVDSLREVSKQTGIPATCSSDPHYVLKEDAPYQRQMLKINLKESDASIEEKLSKSDEMDVMPFFGSDIFYVHEPEWMAERFTKEEMSESIKISNLIEEYDILQPPKIPKFEPPEFDDSKLPELPYKTKSDKFLAYLTIDGAKKLKPWENSTYTKEEYWKRAKYELEIYIESGLSDYLLLVWDILQFCRNRPANGGFDWQKNLKDGGETNPILVGHGRGSVGGSLVGYLIDLHRADSLKYGLLFARFFNKARAKDLADIDNDLEAFERESAIEYLKWKYGERNVAGIITFGRIQGKAAIKDLMRIKGIENHFEVANKISEFIPDEAKIADQIQEVRDSGEEYGIIQWAIDNNSDDLQPFYEKYKDVFDEGIKIEGTPRNAGRHASGYVITPESAADETFPMALDTKTKKKVIAFDMNNVSKLSGVKIDLLGLSLLDRIKKCQDLVNAKA